jgi:hypothetical protein
VDGQQSYDRWELKGVLTTRTCPRRLTDAESYEWLPLFSHYRAGHLLTSGGIMDQPAAYFEAMNLIQHWIAQDRDNPAS